MSLNQFSFHVCTSDGNAILNHTIFCGSQDFLSLLMTINLCNISLLLSLTCGTEDFALRIRSGFASITLHFGSISTF